MRGLILSLVVFFSASALAENNEVCPTQLNVELFETGTTTDLVSLSFGRSPADYFGAEYCSLELTHGFWGLTDDFFDNVDVLSGSKYPFYHFPLYLDFIRMAVFDGTKSGAAKDGNVLGNVELRDGRYVLKLSIPFDLVESENAIYLKNVR